MDNVCELITQMELLRDVINKKEWEDPEKVSYYRGKLDGLKDTFLLVFGLTVDEDMCEYVINI